VELLREDDDHNIKAGLARDIIDPGAVGAYSLLNAVSPWPNAVGESEFQRFFPSTSRRWRCRAITMSDHHALGDPLHASDQAADQD
jgi:hypothetical protein